ncbi:Lead, cadmium, zinc and mercury transporting ATPase [Desulfosporosinus metallidurans]|nr:Lead, cadmium, zinc and mercury transporting ATPase [Desulfosporosinus metallidurans]
MERIEAGVTLVPIQTKQKVATPDNTAAAAKENKRRLTRIMIAGVLFAVGLVF